MGVLTNDDIKKLSVKKLSKCFFKEEIWITLLSEGVKSANAEKGKTVFRVIFFGFRELVSLKT